MMLILQFKEWYDLTYIGIYFAALLSAYFLFLPINILFIMLLEVSVLLIIYFFYRAIQSNKLFGIMVNTENQWFVQTDDEQLLLELKDYWLVAGFIFLWLKGSNKSVSIMVSRSIIGAEKFSQLRTKII
jgi:hypothetical protein